MLESINMFAKHFFCVLFIFSTFFHTRSYRPNVYRSETRCCNLASSKFPPSVRIIIFQKVWFLIKSVQLFKLKCLRKKSNKSNLRSTYKTSDRPEVRLKIKKSASAWIIFVFVIVWINGLIENLDKEKTFTERTEIIKIFQLEENKNDMYMLSNDARRMQFESGYEKYCIHVFFDRVTIKIYSLN